jgi:heat shock protein HslJ
VRTGRLSPDALAGTEWVLRRWAWQEPAPGEPAVTLRFADGRFAGSAGCNSYTAPVQAGKQPGDISVGPAAATRKTCPEPTMGIESRFLSALGAVEQFSFRDGRLVLTYRPENKGLLFERAPAR